ncbi:thioredoxin family protein [Alkalicoccus halolimnae]|uniref:Thioredoxin family protein n=1 Tax=Alkalicoccus halolimnae TaxID=1667239 RepID=A0A5C7FM91_9BACI|nr:thioredoxin family protein [Alkalicoccus halolimnae]TXF85865.1 thioredoxin family protein [Alkalicoccus halolimnae]
MKKLLMIGGVVVVIFAALIFVTSYQNEQAAQGNPFGLDSLHQETIDQLDNPLYENIILPEELDSRLDEDGSAMVYFYSGQCQYCNETTPVIVPLAEDMNVDLELYNILEFDQGWDDYGIEGTPTVIYFENGEEADRISGMYGKETYEAFFEQAANE